MIQDKRYTPKELKLVEIEKRCMMDAGIGIGGLSTGKDEAASGRFNLFEDAEIENVIDILHL